MENINRSKSLVSSRSPISFSRLKNKPLLKDFVPSVIEAIPEKSVFEEDKEEIIDTAQRRLNFDNEPDFIRSSGHERFN